MRTILISLDSLNRHFLKLYNPLEGMDLPHLQALAAAGVVFDSHFTGSAPCMPARREFMTGRLELMHREWGPLEAFDRPLSQRLKAVNCPTMLVTDHYHLFEVGGENYHVDFTGYELLRGHENDNWKTHDVDLPELNPHSHTNANQERNRAMFRTRADFPTARTFAAARTWAQENATTKDFFLFIDEFDPHEPFFAPQEYLDAFDDSGYDGPRLEWPNYGDWQGTEQELQHIRNRYRAKVKFLDDEVGAFIKLLQDKGMYEETTIILTTDHGHYLGEHGEIGKPRCDNWNTLFHIPMVVKPAASLGCETGGRRVTALTTTADIPATILELHGLELEAHYYGQSFLPLLQGTAEKTRDYVLYGYFGDQMGYCDGTHTYLKSPKPDGPLYYYSNTLSTHPGRTQWLRDAYAGTTDCERGPWIPGSDYPVMRWRLPAPPLRQHMGGLLDNVLYAYPADLEQRDDIADAELVAQYQEAMRAAMREQQFPAEHYERLGL